jgi:multidrug resistance efflux pump
MDPLFRQTLRALESDSGAGPRWIGAGVAVVLLLAAGWGALAQVPVRVASVQAEVRASGGRHAVDAVISGRLASLPALGRTVSAGEIVGTFHQEDIVNAFALADRETEALQAAVVAASACLELKARSGALVEDASSLEAGAREALAVASVARRALAERVAESSARLVEEGAVASAVLDRDEASLDNESARALAESRRARVARLTASLALLEQQTGVEQLRSTLRQLEAAAARAERERADARAIWEQHQLRAPVDGTVAWVADHPPGRAVRAGEPLFAVLDAGPLNVVAWFEAARALGPLTAGEVGELRLDAYSWTTWGAVPVQVSTVAAMPLDGRLRVELVVPEPIPVHPKLVHGQSGTVLVEVERAAPLTLALRSLGGVE